MAQLKLDDSLKNRIMRIDRNYYARELEKITMMTVKIKD